MFSLAGLRKIKEEGVYFHSHVDGRKDIHGTGGEHADPVQSRLPPSQWRSMSVRRQLADRTYVQDSVAPDDYRWLERCKNEMQRLNGLEDTDEHVTRCCSASIRAPSMTDIRIDHAKRISENWIWTATRSADLRSERAHEQMYHVLEADRSVSAGETSRPISWASEPRPIFWRRVERGVDFLRLCLSASRNGRHGHAYTRTRARLNLFNQKYEKDMRPIEEGCRLPGLPSATAEPISVICSRPKRCLACACVCCTICTSTTR